MKRYFWSWRWLVIPIVSLVVSASGAGASGEEGQKADTVVVEEFDGELVVSVGALSFGLSTDSAATLRWVDIDGKRVVDDNHEPLLAAQLMESATYNGVEDYVPDRSFIEGQYEVIDLETSVTEDGFEAILNGLLRFSGDDRFPFQIRLSATVGQPHIGINVMLQAEGTFRDCAVRSICLQLPLALDWRKRIAQGGDQGLEWDTRYYYEFPINTFGVQLHPDRNEFRHFGVEQDATGHFRIWRAESDSTPELVHQHGLEAAGWSSVYDRHGGILFAYRNMAAAAPKTLEVFAPSGGEARVWIYPESAPAFLLADQSATEAVFNRWHETDWIYYLGEHPDANPTQLLTELWEKQEPLTGARPERGVGDLWDADIDLWQAPPAPQQFAPYVSGGIPIRRGEMQPGDHVVLTGPGGVYPCQTKVLAYWPDGSVKWLHLLFPIDGAVAPLAGFPGVPAIGSVETFDVTFRAGENAQSFALYHRADLPPVLPSEIVTVAPLSTGTDGQVQKVRIDTGAAQITVSTGDYWLPEVLVDGHPVWRPGSQGATAFVDFLRPQSQYPARTTHPDGVPDPGPVAIESLVVEESGPLRALVRLQGKALCQEPADVIIRLEFFAGRPWVRVTHSVEFNQKDPRQVFMTGMGVRLPVAEPGSGQIVTFGGQNTPVQLSSPEYAALSQLSHMHYRIRGTRDGTLQTIAGDARSRGWINVADEEGGVTVALRHMWQEYPKELSYSAATGDLTAWLWPASAPVMDVRRYSNYPHRVQGESAGQNADWVESTYYGTDESPGEPFVGVSRSHELLISFVQPEDHAIATTESVVADFESPPLIYSGYDTYRLAGITVPLPDMSRFPLIAANFDNYTDFWLFHQRFWGWYGMWNYGDVQHRFRSGGYGWKIEPDRLKAYLNTPEAQRSEFREIGRLIGDYRAQQDWLFDNGRWGWTNTEGLPGLYFQQEYLRTGRRDVFFMAEALGRHARDVITRQSGRFFGLGTRHGVQHWSDGNHEERQTTAVEYRHHYYLTGDPRSRDVVMKLSDHYSTGTARRAGHNGRIPALFMRWEMTNDPFFGKKIRDYLHAMATPEGFSGYASLRLTPDSVTILDLQEGLNTTTMFFHNFGALNGVIEYFQATGDEVIRDALVKSARATLKPGGGLQQSSTCMALLAGFAANHDSDPAWLIDLIKSDMKDAGTGSRDAFAMVSWNPLHWTGDTAYISRQSPLCWFYMVALPVTLSSLSAEPKPPQRVFDRFEEQASQMRPEKPQSPYLPRVSWQEEYDDPSLSEYFEIVRPVR